MDNVLGSISAITAMMMELLSMYKQQKELKEAKSTSKLEVGLASLKLSNIINGVFCIDESEIVEDINEEYLDDLNEHFTELLMQDVNNYVRIEECVYDVRELIESDKHFSKLFSSKEDEVIKMLRLIDNVLQEGQKKLDAGEEFSIEEAAEICSRIYVSLRAIEEMAK